MKANVGDDRLYMVCRDSKEIFGIARVFPRTR